MIKVQLIGGLVLMTAIQGCSGGGGKPSTVVSHARAVDELRQCDAGPVQRWVGREMSATIEAEALSASGADVVRWIRPGEAITMDYQTDRINLEVDRRGRIVRVHCG